jgi:peptidoglycan/LPS O-acetylase OafA/YrhL
MAVDDKRIEALDGFRALAVLLVISFHYFSRWTPPRFSENLYPYGDRFAGFALFDHGYLGVELFFIVSGFVISLTLFASSNWRDFALRRFARLFPSMLLCSALTFAFLAVLPVKYFNLAPIDFLPSLTFTDPYLWKALLGKDCNYIDGAYWSLFVEVRFYFWACLVFFAFGKERFLGAFSIFFNLALILFAVGQAVPGTFLSTVVEWALFPSFLPWFAAGVGFFFLHRDGRNPLARLLVIESALVVVLSTARSHSSSELPFCLAFYALFTLFVSRPLWLRPFSYKPVTLVGAASYSLYLLHQNLGVTLIATIGGALSGGWSVIVAGCVGIALIAVSVLIYQWWEMPAKRILLALGRGALKQPRAYPGRHAAQSFTAARRYPTPRP